MNTYQGLRRRIPLLAPILFATLIGGESRAATEPEPGGVYLPAKAAIVARMGAEIFNKYVTPRAVQNFEPTTQCVEKPETCAEAFRKAYAWVTFHFRIPEIPFVDVDIACVVDRDEKVREISGVPDCVSRPQECRFPIGEAAARSIATEAGLEPGLEPWRVKFVWNPRFDSYVWGVTNTLHKQSGRGVSIDANDGRVLGIYDWMSMSERVPNNRLKPTARGRPEADARFRTRAAA